MKSERRHELQHNELAEWLFRTGQAIKPYQELIVAAVAVVVVAALVYAYWSSTSAKQSSLAWTQLTVGIENGNLEVLTAVAEENPDSIAAQMATLTLADVHLATGCQQRFNSMALATER